QGFCNNTGTAMLGTAQPDIYTARDIAQAAGVSETRVLQLLARGEIRSIAAQLATGFDSNLGGLVAHHEAVRAVRALTQGSAVGVAGALGLGRELFAQGVRAERSTTVPLIVSTSLHAIAIASILLIASLGFAVADERTEPLKDPEPMRMVFLAIPGPGGGGGGGGLKMKTPPPRAERKGVEKISSPLPARKLPPPMRPEPKPPEPPKPLEAKQLPPVMAPIPTKQAEPEDREGVLAKAPETKPSQGTGTGGGVGSGQGTGLGQGDGSGVGEGSGGGFGGGPFRPGSGVEPPRLLREVKADYTDEARRSNIEGEVELEIVVRRDGTVGDVKILRGLRGGLNDRAMQAVRQWRFSPGRMKGVPVDVVVEVGVEFRLR
ncbi:MAG TPA: TonB family protein, partial [Vicinamibacterales bacterium]|nr:TonB family protein [Vicinamibacterales bacterium]